MFYGRLVHFTRFGMLYQDKSGNPGKVGSRRKSFFGRKVFTFLWLIYGFVVQAGKPQWQLQWSHKIYCRGHFLNRFRD
jgi:hypothetical protein